MSILAENKPRWGTRMARFAAMVESDLWNAAVPVRDTHNALSGPALTLDRARDAICRDIARGMRELMETETDPYKIRQALREWMPALERANLLDARIDLVAFQQAPVMLVQAQDALLVGISRCEGELSTG